MKELSVLIASDSFKGSASSLQIADLLEQGIVRVVPDATVKKVAIADGGEGTLDAIVSARAGEVREVEVTGPIGENVVAHYGLLEDGLAIIEMAESSGITLIDQTPENSVRASTFGVGETILDAIAHGAKQIYIGLGGSATSDGGAGMAKALGIRFLDANGEDIPCGLKGLEFLDSIDCSEVAPELAGVEFVALTDVTNPLTGPTGAVAIYGPQKGIPQSEIEKYDTWMKKYAEVLAQVTGRDIDSIPGAGAAGGLGAALAAFCNAKIARGIESVLDIIGLDELLVGVDLVITGEGRMDAQSAFGKAPVGVALRAKAKGIPVVAVVGSRAEDLGEVYQNGIGLVVPLALGPITLEECMEQTAALVPVAGESAMRAFLLGRASAQ